MKYLLLGILFFILGQVTVWFQINGQFVWKYFKDNPFIISLLGIPISYFFILATQHTVEWSDGLKWPSRFIGFGIGLIVYAVLVNLFFDEGINLKTFISLILSIVIILIQIFWKV